MSHLKGKSKGGQSNGEEKVESTCALLARDVWTNVAAGCWQNAENEEHQASKALVEGMAQKNEKNQVRVQLKRKW